MRQFWNWVVQEEGQMNLEERIFKKFKDKIKRGGDKRMTYL